jgi:hypothetical protein
MESVGLAWHKVGTVNLVQGSATVTGVGTNWLTIGIKVGDLFTVDDTRDYEIASVTSNTQLTLVKPFQGASGAAQNYAIIRNLAATLPAELAAKVSEAVGKFNAYIDADLTKITGPRGDPGWAYKGPWTAGRSYNAMDVVVNSGNALYIALSSHTSASSNAPGNATYWIALGINIQNASETVAGVAQLATAAEVQAGTNDTDIITPAKVPYIYMRSALPFFANYDSSKVGPRYVFVAAADQETAEAPMYELYGIGGNQGYTVSTMGLHGSGYVYLVQEATTTTGVSPGRKFMRTAITSTSATPVWSKWTEVPTLSYSASAMTIIVDGDNGDDTEGNGTEAKPVKTIQAAFALVPRITPVPVGHSISIKPGTYELNTSELLIPQRACTNLYIRAFSGGRDVEIVFTAGASTRGLCSVRSAPVELLNLRFVKEGDNGNSGAMFFHNFFIVQNCEFENFGNGVLADSAMGCIFNCNYINCVTAIQVSRGAHVTHDSNTATNTNYINTANGGTIIKKGSQAVGVVATDKIVGGNIGQII